MLEPEAVSAILRLRELGWGSKRISRELGISRNTVKEYLAAGGWTPYQQPEPTWLRAGLSQQSAPIRRMRSERRSPRGSEPTHQALVKFSEGVVSRS